MSIAMPQYDTPAAKKPRRMPLSQKRIDANRRNARRSTGPRTSEGKKRSSQNGRVAHSTICSVDASVTTENDGTFFCHVQDMHDIFKPHTVLQQQLFPQLCALQWSLNRMMEAEVKLYQKLAKRPDEPPCEILARVFLEHPTRNPLAAFARYWRQRQAEYLKLVKEYDRISERADTVDPEEARQWAEARRLQEERERRMRSAEMARLAAEGRAEVERLDGAARAEEGGTGLQPVQHGSQTHATNDTPATREPTSGGATGDGVAESKVLATSEEKAKPVAGDDSRALAEGDACVAPTGVERDATGEPTWVLPNRDTESESPVIVNEEEKAKPLHRGMGASPMLDQEENRTCGTPVPRQYSEHQLE